MSLNNFIPQLWAGELLKNLNAKHVYVQGCSRTYEGAIKSKGDSVKINSIGRVTIGTYSKYSSIGSPEVLDDSQMTLDITEQDFYHFHIDDIDKAQQQPQVRSEAMREAAWGLADSSDVFVANMLTNNVDAGNVVSGTQTISNASDAYDLLVDLGVILDEDNVPDGDRWIVVPHWFMGELMKDERFVSFGTAQNRKNLSGEKVKRAARFDLLQSNNVPTNGAGTEWDVLAGYSGAVTFADQIPPGDVEAYRPEQHFSDAMKGLHVYGGKVTRPYGLAKVVIDKP